MTARPLDRDRRQAALLSGLAVLLLGCAYSQHFRNGFHFDDAHTLVDNPWIRDLANLPRFFRDAGTMSVLPANQTYRPLLTSSLAWDYHLGGLQPLWFHVHSFATFALLLAVLWPLYRALFALTSPASARRLASVAAGTFALHPAMAETVNYLVQRAEMQATLGLAASLLLYIRLPRARAFGLYLLPMLIGALAKVPSLTFAGVLVLYIWLFECDARPRRLGTALWRGTPALLAAGAAGWAIWRMTPAHYAPSHLPAFNYWISQPYVLLRYLGALVWPTHLSADTDLHALALWHEPRALLGMGFWLLLVAAALAASRTPRLRLFTFGAGWFVITSVPSSVFVLAEVENDHRMFLPFVGGVLAAVSLVAAGVARLGEAPGLRARMLTGTAVLAVWCALAWGTWQRNGVWRDELSLMGDVVIKSPGNARGWMNYGVAQLAVGQFAAALQSLEQAHALNPVYPMVATNLGVAHGTLGHAQEAERWFKRALAQAPEDASAKYFYARWLHGQGRLEEASGLLQIALYQNRALMAARALLMRVYLQEGRDAALQALALDTLALAPHDAEAQRMLRLVPQAQASLP